MLRFISLMVGEGEEMNFKDCFSQVLFIGRTRYQVG